MNVAIHDVEHVTNENDLIAQLPAGGVAYRKLFSGGYYAASGVLDNGETVEMWISEERATGCQSTASYVYLALNGRCNRRRYALNGETCDLADWLRGRHTGSKEQVKRLGSGGRRILDGLYLDVASTSNA